MASHDVALKVATELPVGGVDLEIPVKRNGRRIGTFTVNANGVSWNPSTSRPATSVSWEDLPAALSSTQAAPAAAPAKKSTPAKKSAPAQKSAPAEESAPAQKAAPAKKTAAKKSTAKTAAKKTAAPVEEPAAPAETPAPEASAPATAPAKKTARSAAKKSTAKKAAPAATGAVDARAVREWAAGAGIAVAPRGPISTSIIEQYRAAQG
ncbi:Lsr2 family DNA-binding protein [Kineococcus sp. SYSU DK004]|uniref:Lsr2 family DNA-binding protein n=1 Tax=Kineococcus sp. SYSU DK004 TaxID=3383125 RepID=UPI003D7D343E